MKFFPFLLMCGIVLVITLELFVLLREERAPWLVREPFYATEALSIESVDHKERSVGGDKPFTKFEGEDFGLTWHNNFSVLEFFQPFSRGRGIAAGDFNNDGWQDVLLGTNMGILLYENLGGRFKLRDVSMGNIGGLELGVHVAMFVDIDNDGWQDIYLTTYGGKNFFLLNDKKGFKNPKVLQAPNTGAVLTSSVSFGDLNKNGWLDFVQGNWMPFPTKAGAERNKIVRNNYPEFVEEELQEVSGQTLSVLLADFTNDNNLDLMAGDEFEMPDNFYVGDGEGGLRLIKRSDGVVPASAHFNMGADIVDFNNDLLMDVYLSGVSTYKIFTENPCPAIQNSAERRMCERNNAIIDIVREGSIQKCAELAEARDKSNCVVIILQQLAHVRQDKELCDKIPKEYILQRLICGAQLPSQRLGTQGEPSNAIAQLPWQNVLLQGGADGTFKEVAEEKNVHSGHNSWNAKFADVDNDEWQDIYVATGELISWGSVFQPNIFFHNQKGEFFEAKQEEFGLEDVGITPSYVYIDIDNDGDLDIITAPINEPLKVYINNESTNNSIIFEFQDQKGNRFGVGNKVYIYYGENSEKHQVRQIKSGGGFLSFDLHIAHFGLGKYNRVNRVEVVWSTGEKTTLAKEFLANKKYVVARKL